MSDQQIPQTPVPTSASEWGREEEQGFVTTLPSGKVARIKRTMDIMALLRTGRIPNPLRGLIEKSISTGSKEAMLDPSEMNGEVLAQLIELLDSVVVKAFLEPKVVQQPAPPEAFGEDATEEEKSQFFAAVEEWEKWRPPTGYISTGMIGLDDKMFVFMVAQGMVNDLERFRQATAPDVAAVQDGGAVPDDTVQPAGA